MNDQEQVDLLQIKIDKAKAQLGEDTLNAIAAVPWQATILKMRETRGYSFEQLGDLEIETELVLCGLLAPKDYPKELENRLHLPKTEVDDLVKEMNSLVFERIKENLIKNIEGKKLSKTNSPLPEYSAPKAEGGGKTIHPGAGATPQEGNKDTQVLKSAEIEIIPPHPILAEKLSGFVKNEVRETEHSLNNISKTSGLSEVPVSGAPTAAPTHYPPKEDPYRLRPE